MQAHVPQTEIERLKAEVELLTSTSSDVVYRLRYETMRYDYISPSITKLLGFSAEELQHINLRSLIMETRIVTDAMRVVDSYLALEEERKTGQVLKWQADYLMKTKDGRKIWVADVSYPWFDDTGAIIGSIGTLRDISDRIFAEDAAKLNMVKARLEDELTGLALRPVFFDRLDEELRRLKRNRSDVSMLLIALDSPDVGGAPAPAEQMPDVLKEITRLIRASLRETDLAARIAEEEFAVILPDTPVEGAFWVGDRIRESVNRYPFRTAEGKLLGITVSVGVAGAQFDDNHECEALFKIAQSRLFIARSTGKNQVSLDELVNVH